MKQIGQKELPKEKTNGGGEDKQEDGREGGEGKVGGGKKNKNCC